MTSETGRRCPECTAPVIGRSDKRFCSERCQQRQGGRRYHAANRDRELQRARERRAANPEYYKAQNRAWHAANKDRARELSRRFVAANPNIHVLYIHGITPAVLDALYEAQGGLCAICQREAPKRGPGCLHIDHDHATGERRGLICNACNRALWAFEKFGGSWALRALAYLGDPPLRRLRKDEAV